MQAQFKATRADFERQVGAARAQIDQANERIAARTGRNLVLAIIIGLVLGFAMLFSLIFVKEIFVLFAATAMVFTTLELVAALKRHGRRLDAAPAVVAGLAIVVTAYFADSATRWAVLIASLVFVVVWRLVAQMVSGEKRAAYEVVRDLVVSVFVQVYVPFLASFALALVALPDGQWWTLAFIVLVVVIDIGAYASGLTFGRHPMAPRISPKKTWEGLAGAAVTAIIAGVLLAIFMLGIPWWAGVVFGVALLGTATMGDLTESLIKRDMGVKDMSSWIPGHGGFLDRLDSILPSAPVALAMYVIFAPLWGTVS
ncbi:hypothetical protein GCM10027416_13990 [Okibacterium endophyticum]